MAERKRPEDKTVPDTVADMLNSGRQELARHSDNPRLEAELLMADALGVDRSRLYAHPEAPLSKTQLANFSRVLKRRVKGEPLAYITGEKEFWSLCLKVSSAVLIPRPETELLVELALERARDGSRIADLGTGSGAVAIAIARELPGVALVATEASEPALKLARSNAEAHGAGNVEFRRAAAGDWLGVLGDEKFGLIVSNPPYVSSADPLLKTGDIRFEPQMALASGRDGLDALRQIVGGAAKRLESGGWLLVEHGNTQGDSVRRLFATAGFSDVATHRDLADQERVTLGRLPS